MSASQNLIEQPAPEQVFDKLHPQVDELTERISKLYNQRYQLSNSLSDIPPAGGPRVVGEVLRLR